MRYIQHPITHELIPESEYIDPRKPPKYGESAMVFGDITPYDSPIDGRAINGRNARKEDFKRNGCRPYEGRAEEEKEIQRQKEYEHKKMERELHESTARAFYQLSPEKRKHLTDAGYKC